MVFRAIGVALLAQRASEDDMEAQYSMGCHQAELPDCEQGGMLLVERAATQGHAHAMQWLGQIHEKKEEYEHAVVWYTRAAEAGLPMANHRLGCCNQSGANGAAAPDYPAAVRWFTKGAEAGMAVSMCCLAMLLDEGKGVAAPDYPAAANWYKRAAAAGPGSAEMTSTGRATIAGPLRERAEAGSIGTAAYNLAAMYTNGRGVTRSKRRALQCLRQAADKGHHKVGRYKWK